MKKLFYSFLLLTSVGAQAQHITTIAGTAAAGFSGENGPATSAMLNGPLGIVADNAGNIYFADRYNQRVRKINSAGIITTIAGTGTAGYNGDAIPATTAQLNDPFGVAIDLSGNIYVAEHSGNRVRRIDNVGAITTVAGTGIAGYNGDDIAATTAQLNQPRGVATDKYGHLYIADQANSRVRMLTFATGIITTMAGNGMPGFGGDNGPATAAMLNGPYAMGADTLGNLFICDVDNERIRKVNAAGIITTVAGTGVATYTADGIPATNAALNEPIGIAVTPAGEFFIADAWNERIRRVDIGGTIITYAGDGAAGLGFDNVAATAARFYYPYGIALTPNGSLLVSDHGNYRIRQTYAGVGVAGPAKQAIALKVYPNPATGGSFTIAMLAEDPEEVTIKIYDLAGRCVYEQPALTTDAVPCQLHTAGVYLVSVVTEKGAAERLVVVE